MSGEELKTCATAVSGRRHSSRGSHTHNTGVSFFLLFTGTRIKAQSISREEKRSYNYRRGEMIDVVVEAQGREQRDLGICQVLFQELNRSLWHCTVCCIA